MLKLALSKEERVFSVSLEDEGECIFLVVDGYALLTINKRTHHITRNGGVSAALGFELEGPSSKVKIS